MTLKNFDEEVRTLVKEYVRKLDGLLVLGDYAKTLERESLDLFATITSANGSSPTSVAAALVLFTSRKLGKDVRYCDIYRISEIKTNTVLNTGKRLGIYNRG